MGVLCTGQTVQQQWGKYVLQEYFGDSLPHSPLYSRTENVNWCPWHLQAAIHILNRLSSLHSAPSLIFQNWKWTHTIIAHSWCRETPSAKSIWSVEPELVPTVPFLVITGENELRNIHIWSSAPPFCETTLAHKGSWCLSTSLNYPCIHGYGLVFIGSGIYWFNFLLPFQSVDERNIFRYLHERGKSVTVTINELFEV